jgi:hypothetical protein
VRRESPPQMPKDDSKPLSALSLAEIQQKKNNQREPSPKHLYDLKSALSAIVKDPPKKAPEPVKAPAPAPAPTPPKAKEVPEDMLKSLLGDD